MKYTIQNKGSFLANPDNSRMLFDSKLEAEQFKKKHKIDASVHGYMDAENMKQVYGYDAYKLFNNGENVYTKIFGLNWSLCEKGKFNLDDFTKGYFNFYVIKQ